MYKLTSGGFVYDKSIDEKTAHDGWAHVENMETIPGALRELQGLLTSDRHERIMDAFNNSRLKDTLKEASKLPVA